MYKFLKDIVNNFKEPPFPIIAGMIVFSSSTEVHLGAFLSVLSMLNNTNPSMSCTVDQIMILIKYPEY